MAQRVRDLPALPTVVTEILRITRDPDSSVLSLADVLARDQALTAKVLRLANSALFGFPRRIGTLSDAVVLLGFSTIRSLVLAGSAFSVMDRALDGFGLNRGALWQHGMAVAVAARHLAQRAAPKETEEAFIAGLIHDLGKIVLDAYVSEQYQEILRLVQQESRPFSDAEREILGFEHSEVGALVGESWGLPETLVGAIRHHLWPSGDPDEARLPCLVHLGYIAALSAGVGIGIDGLAYRMDPHALERLELDPSAVEEAISAIPDALADADQLLCLQ